jgi:hypothetical protein
MVFHRRAGPHPCGIAGPNTCPGRWAANSCGIGALHR